MKSKEQKHPEPLFDMGEIVATPGAIQALMEAQQHPSRLLVRHVTGDWGDLDAEDKKENLRSLEKGHQIFSAYTLATREEIWVITESDRSSTCILLPDDTNGHGLARR